MIEGYPIVLTADRSLMADYPTLLDGMMASVQTSAVPSPIMSRILAPPMPAGDDGRALRAPLGLRRIESALARAGLGRDTVAIATPATLATFVGRQTKVVGVTSGDPLGRGMTNTTMVDIAGGELYTRRNFRRLCEQINALRNAPADFRLVAGGPGAWQLANDPAQTKELGIDHVVTGYVERDAADLFGSLLAGEPLDPFVTCGRTRLDDIPPIAGASNMGVVEISRGCGRGCGFCTLAREPMAHMPVERIVADVQTNVRAGVKAISLISEDLLRYGSPDFTVRPDALIAMLQAVRAVDGVEMIQVDHLNVASTMQYDDRQLADVRASLRAGRKHEQVWINLGIESASGELLAANGMNGKIHPFQTDQWEQLCEDAVRRLASAGFVPMLSLILGLAGETDEHLQRTIDLVRRLRGMRAVVFPIFYAPIDPNDRPFTTADMTPLHWRLFRLGYDFNFRWIPGMFADNHHAGRTDRLRRMFVQVAGRIQTLQWKYKFFRATGKLRP